MKGTDVPGHEDEALLFQFVTIGCNDVRTNHEHSVLQHNQQRDNLDTWVAGLFVAYIKYSTK